MNQQKIGGFLKELRKEKNLTQEQLAEIVGVSGRSVSRWETGANLPDLDILIQLAEYYRVDIGEILDGERKNIGEKTAESETALKIADYSNFEKNILTGRMHGFFIAAAAAFAVYMVLDIKGLTDIGFYEDIASFSMGFVLGALILGILFTSKYMGKIRDFKMKILKKYKKG